MSTSPPSAGVSSCASTVAASSAATVAGAAPLLRSCGHHLFDGGGCGFGALLMSRGLALQLRYELLNSGGWATTPSWLPHCIPLAFVALISGLRWRHFLQAKEAWSSANELDRRVLDYSTTLLKMTYLFRRGLRDL
jgi:hypothetical protein